ncbi:MAG: hypothetical protein QOE62_3596, partial [Actinomycetota bacterium]|nr:hypothetical protein [Actinomycetota bacterium]
MTKSAPAPRSAGFTTVAGPRNFAFFAFFAFSDFSVPATIWGSARFRVTLNLTTVSGMSTETQGEAGPDLDWMTAQPYDAWAEVRRSDCPVMNAGLDIMGPG